jgi:hypothetical protein
MGQRLLPKGTEVLFRPTAGVGMCSSEGGIEPRPDDGTGDARRTCPKRSDSAASKTNRNSSTPGQHGRPPFRFSVTELILEWCGAKSLRPRCLRGDSRTRELSVPRKTSLENHNPLSRHKLTSRGVLQKPLVPPAEAARDFTECGHGAIVTSCRRPCCSRGL